jgi:two-component system response regulator RegA
MTQRLLLIDDDVVFTQTLARSLTRRGYEVVIAQNTQQALVCSQQPIQQVILDLQLNGDSGLSLLAPLLNDHPQRQILILTGYASITTAVDAIKRGAMDYLCKPVNTSDILKAFANHTNRLHDHDDHNTETNPLTLNRLEWEHLQRVLQEHQGNISACARALNMHRRTLQRKLQKRPSPG